MLRAIFSILLFLSTFTVQATTLSVAHNTYEATLVSVYDGDTFHVRIAIWPGQSIETLVRLQGVDTPEINGRCEQERALAKRARDFTYQYLTSSQTLTLRHVTKDKYSGRVVADAIIGSQSLSEALIASGYAYSYKGGTKRDWC